MSPDDLPADGSAMNISNDAARGLFESIAGRRTTGHILAELESFLVALRGANDEGARDSVRSTVDRHLNFIAGVDHPVEGEEVQTAALFVREPGTEWPRPSRLAAMAVRFIKTGNIEPDILAARYEAALKGILQSAKMGERPDEKAFLLESEEEHALISVAWGVRAPNPGEVAQPCVVVTKYVYSNALAVDFRKRIKNSAAREWASQRKRDAGVETNEEVLDYQLQVAKKYLDTNPRKSLDLVYPLMVMNVRGAEVRTIRDAAFVALQDRNNQIVWALHPGWNARTKELREGDKRTAALLASERAGAQILALVEVSAGAASVDKTPQCEIAVLDVVDDSTVKARGSLLTRRCVGFDGPPFQQVEQTPLYAIRHSRDGQHISLGLYGLPKSAARVVETFHEEIGAPEYECQLVADTLRAFGLVCVDKKPPKASARRFEWTGSRFAETGSLYFPNGSKKPGVEGIVPGRSLGTVALGMKKAAVRKALGKPSGSYQERPNVTMDVWWSGKGVFTRTYEVVYAGDVVEQIATEASAFKLGPIDTTMLTQSGLELLAARTLLAKTTYSEKHDLIIVYFDDAERGVAYRCEGLAHDMVLGKDGKPTGSIVDTSDKLNCRSIVVHRPNAAIIPGADEFKL
jgi:hypothetical protein